MEITKPKTDGAITGTMAEALKAPIDEKYLKPHPSASYLTVIHPMAVIERLNEVIGVGAWNFTTELITTPVYNEGEGKYMATAKGRLSFGATVLEQFGGSSNYDAGDALKGAATDALTKCASYLGIGFEIYGGEKDREGGTTAKTNNSSKSASDKQRNLLLKLLGEKQVAEETEGKIRDAIADESLTSKQASETIDILFKKPNKAAQVVAAGEAEPKQGDLPF